MRQDWGFAEREWEIDYGYHFTNDFLSFDALALEMKQVSLDSQEELNAWLEASSFTRYGSQKETWTVGWDRLAGCDRRQKGIWFLLLPQSVLTTGKSACPCRN
jgi:hypothetical protein